MASQWWTRFIALVVLASATMLAGCGSPHAHSAPAVGTFTPYRWPPISSYPRFAGTAARSNTCVVSPQLTAFTTSTPTIVECWVGKVAGRSFSYVTFSTPDKQGWQVTVDGRTSVGDTNGVPDLYQFGGDFACTGSGAAAWMEAIDLTTGHSYNPQLGPATAKLVDRYCASPNNPAVLDSKHIIGIPGDVSKQPG